MWYLRLRCVADSLRNGYADMPLAQSRADVKADIHFLLLLPLCIGFCVLNTAVCALFCSSSFAPCGAVGLSVDDEIITDLVQEVKRIGRQQDEQIQGMKVIAVLVLHQKVHRNCPEENRHGDVDPAAGAADQQHRSKSREGNHNHVIVIVEIPHLIEEVTAGLC